MIIHNSNKFKLTTVSVRFKEVTNQQTVAFRALLPALMTTKTKSYSTRKKVNEALEGMFGASLSSRTFRLGQLSVLSVTLNIVNAQITGYELFEEGLKLLHEATFGHNNLPKAYFEDEKRLLLQAIKSQKDNKTMYAISKMQEHMFKDELYGIDISGDYDEVNNVTYNDLNKYYKQVLKTNDYDIIVSGDVDPKVNELVNKYFISKNKENITPVDYINKEVSEVKQITDYDTINQAKVNIGYRFPVRVTDENYYAAVLFNATLGGAVHSRLFLNVREKLSLCYYVSSRYDSLKGYIFIYSGIDKDRVDVALGEINKQINDLKTNLISDEELQLSKAYLINSIKEAEDSQSRTVAREYNNALLNIEYNLEEIIDKINSITKENVLEVANLLVEDTIYILAPEDKDEL